MPVGQCVDEGRGDDAADQRRDRHSDARQYAGQGALAAAEHDHDDGRRARARRDPEDVRARQRVARDGLGDRPGQAERRPDQAEHDPDLQLPRPHHDPADDSVVSSSTAPANPEAGSNHRWSGPVKNRATCGTTSPTNPIGPQAATPRR